MRDHTQQPIADWIETIYRVLGERIVTGDEEIHRDRAPDVLAETEGCPDETEDVEYAIKILLDRGYLYEADSYLRVTDWEASPDDS